MSIYLSKNDICQLLDSIVRRWKHPQSGIIPCFITETDYAECFLYYLSMRIRFNSWDNIVPFITERFRYALSISFRNLSKNLEKYPVDGTKIFDIMCQEKFIFRKDRREYNRQVPGKYPKGIKKEEWEDYNHWLLANLYWQGFLWSMQPGFKIILPEDADGPVELFLSNDTKLLWGMRIKALDAGKPIIGPDGDCINVHPYASLKTHFS